MKKRVTAALLTAVVLFILQGCGVMTQDAKDVKSCTDETSETNDETCEPVEFLKKVDGDTAWFTRQDGEEIKVRFLAIDTPETVKEGTDVQAWGPEASHYTTESLENAGEIILEWDENSDLTDAYGRYLAWVWVDGSLLEKELVEQGLAEVAYIYGDYKYVDELYAAQEQAQNNRMGIWSE